jgi:hypothetical protein
VTLGGFCPILPGIVSPCTNKVSFVLVFIEQMGTNFAAVYLIFKSLVEMHQFVLYDGPRMLWTWFIVCCPRGWSDALSPYFHQPSLMIDNWSLKFCPNLITFEMHISFQVCGRVLASSQKVFKQFISLRNCFLKAKTGPYTSSFFLKMCHFTGLCYSKGTTQTHLNISVTVMQHSIASTPH